MTQVKKYRKKPIVIEAIQWDGRNDQEVFDFCPKANPYPMSKCIEKTLIIETLEGNHKASIGDHIIKGVQGEFYPCKPDIFEQTYELATQEPKTRTFTNPSKAWTPQEPTHD